MYFCNFFFVVQQMVFRFNISRVRDFVSPYIDAIISMVLPEALDVRN